MNHSIKELKRDLSELDCEQSLFCCEIQLEGTREKKKTRPIDERWAVKPRSVSSGCSHSEKTDCNGFIQHFCCFLTALINDTYTPTPVLNTILALHLIQCVYIVIVCWPFRGFFDFATSFLCGKWRNGRTIEYAFQNSLKYFKNT